MNLFQWLLLKKSDNLFYFQVVPCSLSCNWKKQYHNCVCLGLTVVWTKFGKSHKIINGIFCCRHEWVQCPFMMATATAKMDIIVTNWRVHIYLKQECIPVGCVPSTAVAVWGVCPKCMLEYVCPSACWDMSAQGGVCPSVCWDMSAQGRVCPSVCWDMSAQGGVCPSVCCDMSAQGDVCPCACWDMSAQGISAPVHAGICLPRRCLPQCMLGYTSPSLFTESQIPVKT